MLLNVFLVSFILNFSLYSMEKSLENLEKKYSNSICSLEHLIETCEAYKHELEADYGQIMALMNISQASDLSHIDKGDMDKLQIYTALSKIPASVYQKGFESVIRAHKKVEYLRRAFLNKKKKCEINSFLNKFNT